jgi:glycosyltransferase involved in cell wall biosynthesis
MPLFWALTGGILALLWVARALEAAIGLRSIPDISSPEWDRHANASLTVIVPARDEADAIETCLRSLLASDLPNLRVIAVNDRSTDATGEIMDRIAAESADRLHVVHVTDLPSGWLGKTHAMWLAGKQANTDWLLFTDGDVIFRADALRRALAHAIAIEADHFVLFPTVILQSVGERMMIGFFQVMSLMAHRAWKVADPNTRDHAGVGAFNLVRREVYEKVGGFGVMPMKIVEDLHFGSIIKWAGFKQRLGYGVGLVRLRWAVGVRGMLRNIEKSIFAIFRLNIVLSLAAAVMTLILNVLPFIAVFLAPGWTKAGFAVALLTIFAMYVGMSSKSKVSPLYVFTHPISSVLVAGTIAWAAISAQVRGGVVWRGTKYSLAELREHL